MALAGAQVGDHTVRQHMSTPVALAWHRVHGASGAAGRLNRATATLEIVLRLTAVVALADYLRGASDPRVEQHIEKLGRPTLGTWLGLARDALRVAHERSAPLPFVPDAYAAWFDDRDRPRDVLRRLDELVALRNQMHHGAAIGGDASDAARAVTFVDGLREVLASVRWLMRYRLVSVVDQAPTRSGTTRGRVQTFSGQIPPEPITAEWTARLFADAVYLCTPTGDAILELSPLVAVLPEPQLGVDKLFLLHAIHRSGDLVLSCDETGHTERVRAQQDGAPVGWAAWLDGRAAREPVQPNRDVGGTLSSPLGGAAEPPGALGARYELAQRLGEGGMAVVYRAHDRVADVDVAIKMLRPEVATDPEIRARFKREAATMAGMRHPRVLSGVTIGEGEDGALYIAMPLFEGGTVADRLAAGTVGPDERARWTRQLLEALVHLGEKRVVHRDVKPSNLLLDAAGDVVLADFGIALGAKDARLTRTLTQLGSLAYMAPESRRGEADAASDAYSAAIVLHELYCGLLPRGAPGAGVGGAEGELIRALGALDPAERPTAAEALALLDGGGRSLGSPIVDGAQAPVVSADPATQRRFASAWAALLEADPEAWGRALEPMFSRYYADAPPMARLVRDLGAWLFVFGGVPVVVGPYCDSQDGRPISASTEAGAVRLALAQRTTEYGMSRQLREMLPGRAGVLGEVVLALVGDDLEAASRIASAAPGAVLGPLVVAHVHRRRRDGAAALAVLGSSGRSESPSVVALQALLLLEAGDVEAASERAAFALERDPMHPHARIVAGEAAWLQGDDERGRSELARASELLSRWQDRLWDSHGRIAVWDDAAIEALAGVGKVSAATQRCELAAGGLHVGVPAAFRAAYRIAWLGIVADAPDAHDWVERLEDSLGSSAKARGGKRDASALRAVLAMSDGDLDGARALVGECDAQEVAAGVRLLAGDTDVTFADGEVGDLVLLAVARGAERLGRVDLAAHAARTCAERPIPLRGRSRLLSAEVLALLARLDDEGRDLLEDARRLVPMLDADLPLFRYLGDAA